MADTPVWVQLIVPLIAATATGAVTWFSTRFEGTSLRRLKQFDGTWFAYYLNPDTKKVEEEIWYFSSLGNATVSREGKTTFKGRLTLRGNKAYMTVRSVFSPDERLIVMLDSPVDPRTGGSQPSPCIWLGKDRNQKTTAGHGLLSRTNVTNPVVKSAFLSI